MAPKCCSICLDEDIAIPFHCSSPTCNYQLCGACVREAFKDSSGKNNSRCPMCKIPSDMDMISALCGPGAIKAVERKVRSSIEFELKAEMAKKEVAKKSLVETNTRARHIFNRLTDEINLRCPRCKTVFLDYDGCNALSCGVASCGAGFCAICLEDCGTDAHEHVRNNHGSYFDKAAFHTSTRERALSIIQNRMREISNESFELKQLVMNHIDKAKIIDGSRINGRNNSSQFLRCAKEDLLKATRNDRLALMSNPTNLCDQELSLSPQCAIPKEFRVTLVGRGQNTYRIVLEHSIDGERWENIPVHDVKNALKDIPKVDMLNNLAQTLKCAVVAFDGHRALYQTRQSKPQDGERLDDDQICISMTEVTRKGELQLDGRPDFQFLRLKVLGFNPNLRMLMLESHINSTSDCDLLFDPLRHLIGEGDPVPVLTEILRPVPKSQNTLNVEQQKVAHPLKLKTAMEVAGPPGTGKTKTIVELVRSMLECTDCNIVVLSERNGAINAIAEKFAEVSITRKTEEGIIIKDPSVWMSLMTYGSGDSIGSFTKLFTLEGKLSDHPDLLKLEANRKHFEDVSSSLLKKMLEELANRITIFGDAHNADRAYSRSRSIRNDEVHLNSPLTTIRYVQETVKDLESILSDRAGNVTEERTEKVVIDRSALLSGLIYVRTDPEKDADPRAWDIKGNSKRLAAILTFLQDALKTDIFNEDTAMRLCNQLNVAKQEYKDLHTRLTEELPNRARLHMSTIGSSHRLPFTAKKSSDLVEGLGRLFIDGVKDSDAAEEEVVKETVVIFDEAGCIPSYELLGLSRLGLEVVALILVGDKHQLPPYDPSQGNASSKPSYGSRRRERQPVKPLKSLLDVSTLSLDDGKVALTTQYRVPKDIADMLNSRIYKGSYQTCPKANVPLLGLNVVNVPKDPNPRRKYINANEVERGLSLVDELRTDNRISNILIITPYKNQQREFEFKLKLLNMTDAATVLTIDQCQGQEADAVILSLVQKPTRFLNKNRLNVALSRVRKKLFVLVDKNGLRQACRNSHWESSLLASDLLN